MRIFNFLLTFFVVYFSIPVVLILISWNTLPGQNLYIVKRSLEDLVLVLTAKTPLASRLSVSFTERRFSEADMLLSSEGSVVGFELLVAGAETSRDIIVEKEDVVQAEVLVEKIEKFQKEIEQKKEVLQLAQVTVGTEAEQQNQPTQRSILTPTPVAQERVVVPTQAGTEKPKEVNKEPPRPSSQEVVTSLQQTQVKLEEIKEEVREKTIQNRGGKHKEQDEKETGGKENKDKSDKFGKEIHDDSKKKDEDEI